jgi:hypothetical protein
MMTETDTRDLLHDAGLEYDADSPPPLATILADGSRARKRRSRKRALTGVAGSLLVVAVVGAALTLPRDAPHSQGPTSPNTPIDTSHWEDLTGTELADALGLTSVPLAEVNESYECSGDDGINDKDGLVFKGNPDPLVYCYLPADYGITDPVDVELLQWQLVGVPRSPDLIELARLEAELHHLPDRSPDGTVTTDDMLPLLRQIEQLRERLFPPDGQLGPWLKAHPEYTDPLGDR